MKASDDLEINQQTDNLEDQLAQREIEVALLKEKLDKYETAARGANDGLWDWDIEKNEPFVSKPWKEMLGIDDHESIDLRSLWQELLHPADQERALDHFKKFIRGKIKNYLQEFRLKHRDGTYRWILSKAEAIRNADGRALRVSGSHTDVTDRKLVTDALRKSEEKYRNLFQNSLVAMFRSEADTGRIIEANEKFWQLVNVKKEHSNESIFDMFYLDKDRRAFLKLIKKHGAVDNLELQIKTANDQTIWISFSAALYPEENILECILKDISQTKENLLELQKVNFELDSFVYHASHDLRSPLRSILGLIDLYRMEHDQEVRNECIEKIEGSVKRLDDLVMELLSISRNDRVNDPFVEVNLMVEINHSISSYYNATNTTGLEVITKVIQPVKFKSDLTRVRILLNNLISNAIKYRSYHKDRSYVYIEAVVDNEKSVIKVEDNGEGIEESKLPHIFDMFYRATEKSEGSGLGLYIVKKVADKLNAKIEVASVELEGTKFKITIPNTSK